MKHIKFSRKLLPLIFIVIWGVACFVFFQFYYPYHFFYKEQNQIFLMSWSYALTYFSKPAWVACLIGDFLTQFYYYLYAGAIILTLSLLTMGDIIRRSLERAGLKTWLSFVIAILVMTLEAIFHFKVGFRLASTMAIIGGSAMFYIISILLRIDRIRQLRWMGNNIVLVFAVITYWMFGYGWLIFVVLSVISGLKHISIKSAVSRLCYIPLLLICIPYMKNVYLLNAKKNILYPGIGELSKPEMLFENYLAVDNEYYFGHYGRVMMMCSKMDSIPAQIAFFNNLSIARQGMLADCLTLDTETNLGTFYHLNGNTPLLTIKMMNELYYVLGDMTMTERAAMLANVFSPDNRNVRMIKRLAEVNLVNNDIPAAMKYLRILDNTLVYRKWAEEHTPGTQTAMVKKEIAEKKQYVNKTDTIRLTDDTRQIMIGLLQSNPKNKVALDYLLCSELQLRQIGAFKMDYDRFYPLQQRSGKEFLYRQALQFYEMNKPKDNEVH